MAENKKPKEHLSWWYFLAKYVMLFFFKILHPYRIIGRENMPLTGKLLVCSNHVTMGEPDLPWLRNTETTITLYGEGRAF